MTPESTQTPPVEGGEEIQFFVSSGYGHNTRQPFVTITVGTHDLHLQITPQKANEIAGMLLAAAAAAKTDAALIDWLHDAVGVDMADVASVLMEFRKHRGDAV